MIRRLATRFDLQGMVHGSRLEATEPRAPPDAHSAQSQRRGPADRRPGPSDGVLRRAGLGAVAGLHRCHVAVQDGRQPPTGLHDDLLAQLGGPEVAAALAGEPTGEAVLSIHVASDEEVDAALQAAVGAGGVMVKEAAARWAAPTGSSPTPTAMSGRSSTTRSTGSEPTGGPRSVDRPSGALTSDVADGA